MRWTPSSHWIHSTSPGMSLAPSFHRLEEHLESTFFINESLDLIDFSVLFCALSFSLSHWALCLQLN